MSNLLFFYFLFQSVISINNSVEIFVSQFVISARLYFRHSRNLTRISKTEMLQFRHKNLSIEADDRDNQLLQNVKVYKIKSLIF